MQFQSEYDFPHPAVADPDGHGMVAIGGDLQSKTLLHAYSSGLFPWFNEGEPIAWWSPEPRCVVYPEDFSPKKSLKKTIKKQGYWVSVNCAFAEVISQCAELRAEGTWITEDMMDAYCTLNEMGYAHSFEVWSEQPVKALENVPVINPNAKLIGGLYGLKIGNCFFGESMFHTQTDCSKIAFTFVAKLAQESNISIIDCQVESTHLLSLGAVCIKRQTFLNHVKQLTKNDDSAVSWQADNFTETCFPATSLLDDAHLFLNPSF